MVGHSRTLAVAVFGLVVVYAAQGQPFVEATAGTYPVILSAPHGGYLTPDSLKDRTCSACVTVRDTRTQEWARGLSDALFARTGRRPHAVINLLARAKLDANRAVAEAADGDANAEAAWAEYHGALEAASDAVTAEHGRGVVLDLHGHGHAISRFELGYLISASWLRESDASLDNRAAQSSVLALASTGVSLSLLLRGPNSFGEFLQQQGVAATPSQTDPAPMDGESFFSGGYITRRHGSRDGGSIDAIQLEAHYSGARNSDANVALLSEQVADAVVAYMNTWYPEAVGTGLGKPPPPQPTCLSATRQGLRACQSGVVTVYDVLGRRLVRTRISSGSVLELRLTSGMYFARLENGQTLSFLR